MPDVFLSYCREDLATASLYAKTLEQEGFHVWWDQALSAGQTFDKTTEKALKDARAVVVLWSKQSVESRWVRSEATQADRYGTLVPAMIEACDRPIMFELTHTADLSGWNGDTSDPRWRSFIAGLRQSVERAEAPAASATATKAAPVGAVPGSRPAAGKPVSIAAAPRPGLRDRWPLAVAVAAALAVFAASAAALVYFRAPVADLRVTYATILPPGGSTFDFVQTAGPVALSPDGRSMVFTAANDKGERQLWIRALDTPEPVPLPGTAGARFPFWSPDSRWVAFYAEDLLKKVDTRGGAPVSLTAAQGGGAGGSWSSQGQIVFCTGIFSPLMKIPADGGTPALAAETDVSGHGFPWFLPDGEHFLFTSWPGAGRAEIRLGSLGSTASTIVGQADSNVIYAQGRLLYLRGSSLVAQPFDAKSLRTTGEAMLVAEPVQRLGSLVVTGVFSASQTGLVTYQKGTDTAMSQLTWLDRAGKTLGTLGDPKAFFDIRLSPDRKTLLASAPDAVGNFDLWAFDLARGLASRFTTDAGGEYYGVWSADGRTVIFNSTRRGHYDLFRKPASGAGPEELVFADATDKVPTSLSSDSRYLLYFTGGGQRYQLWRLSLQQDPAGSPLKPEPLLNTPFDERWGQFSPDDRWIVYETNESGRSEIYAAPFSRPTEKHQISPNGGELPRWRHDGQAIFYRSLDGRLQEALVRIAGDAMEVTSLHPVLVQPGSDSSGYAYDLSEDGQKVLMAVPVARAAEPLTLVGNWTAIKR